MIRTNILEVYVSYLRRKLQRTGSPAPIVTSFRSVGYKLARSGGEVLAPVRFAGCSDARSATVLIGAFLLILFVFVYREDRQPAARAR